MSHKANLEDKDERPAMAATTDRKDETQESLREKEVEASSDASLRRSGELSVSVTARESPAPLVDGGAVDDYVTGWKLFSLIAAMAAACFLMLLDMSILVTAIPRITSQFHSLEDIGWYGSAYNLASAALQPLSGKFYTYFRIKWVFLAMLCVFEVGSLICAVATSSKMFIIGRAVAGLGSSGIQNGSFAIIAAAAPLERRPALFGIVMGVCQLGLVSGPLIGGALTQYTTWRWCFYINLPIGAAAALLMGLIHIPERIAKPKGGLFRVFLTKFDLPGFILFAPFAIMILLALEWGGNQYPWRSATIIGLFCGGGGALALFVLWEWRVGRDAMIPLYIVRKRQVYSSCLTMLFLVGTVMGTSYYLPIYFQSIKGASPFTSGVNMLPVILPQLFFAVSSGFLLQKVGYYLPFTVVSAIVCTIGSGLLSTLTPSSGTARWAGFQVLIGFGRGLGMQTAIIALQAHTAPEVSATATAILVFCQTFSGAIFLSIANSIFNNQLRSQLRAHLGAGADVQAIINAGATAVRSVASPQDLPIITAAYAKSFDAVMYFLTAMGVCMFVSGWGMGWTDIRKKKVSAMPATEP